MSVPARILTNTSATADVRVYLGSTWISTDPRCWACTGQ